MMAIGRIEERGQGGEDTARCYEGVAKSTAVDVAGI